MNDHRQPVDSVFTKKEFENLFNVHNAHCISIYIPTLRAGKEVDEGQGQLLLKNCLKELDTLLQNYELTKNQAKEYLEPIRSLLDEIHFWRNQSDGLAIFLQKNELNYYTLPLHFEKFIYVADHFYLKPLLPVFNGDGRFFLLSISLQDIKFYEGSQHNITEVSVTDLVPGRWEDVVGYDYSENFLQFRSGLGGGGAGAVFHAGGVHAATSPQGNAQGLRSGAIFHGHGSGKDDRKIEILKFFRVVDEGLMKLLFNEDVPLVLACVDYHYPIYKEASAYPDPLFRHISGNPEHESIFLLHEKAWQLVNEFYQTEKNKRLKQFLDLSETERTLWKEDDIVTAAINGRIDTLFINTSNELYGVYDKSTLHLRLDPEKLVNNASIQNLCATHTFMQGGKVYLMSPEEMPITEAPMNALLRY